VEFTASVILLSFLVEIVSLLVHASECPGDTGSAALSGQGVVVLELGVHATNDPHDTRFVILSG